MMDDEEGRGLLKMLKKEEEVVEWVVEEVVGGGRGKGLYRQGKVLFATHVRGRGEKEGVVNESN